MQNKESVLTLPSLGRNVQLGMLYDVRTSSFFGGVSLWNDADINGDQETTDQVQGSDYKLSLSLEEARTNAGLDMEGSLNLDLKLLKATGSAKCLSEKKRSTYEARVDVSCTVARRARRISQEKLVNMPYEKHLDDLRFTHYVAEVVEGGTATLSFCQVCKSEKDRLHVQGELELDIKAMPIWGKNKTDYKSTNNFTSKSLRISYSGALVESASTMDDARRVAREMPKKLAQQMNTLSFVLVPVSVLDNRVRRQIRELDDVLLRRTAMVLAVGEAVCLDFDDLHQSAVSRGTFPNIHKQILGFREAFGSACTKFTQSARCLLPQLRDGTTDYKPLYDELTNNVVLFEQRTEIAKQFITEKRNEACVLTKRVEELLADGFEDHFSISKGNHVPLLDAPPRLIISLGEPDISLSKHPLQVLFDSPGSSTCDDDNGIIEQHQHQHHQTLRSSCARLRSLRNRLRELGSAGPDVVFAVVSINKAFLPGETQPVATQMGDVILDHERGMEIITSHIPGSLLVNGAPFAPVVFDITSFSMSVEIPWLLRGEEAEAILRTTGAAVRWCAKPNPESDGATEMVPEIVLIDRTQNVDTKILSNLKGDCNYDVQICLVTAIGPTEWSAPTTVRTEPFNEANCPQAGGGAIGMATGAGVGAVVGATGVGSCSAAIGVEGVAIAVAAVGAAPIAAFAAVFVVVPAVLGLGVGAIVEVHKSHQHESFDASEARYNINHKQWSIAAEEGIGNVRVCRYKSEDEARHAFGKIWCSRVLYDPEGNEVGSGGINGWAVARVRCVMTDKYFSKT